MKCNSAFALAGLGLAMLATPILAQNVSAGPISVSKAWTRQTAPNQSVGGGFLTIRNVGKTDDRLLTASTPLAAEVQIHSMSMDKGVMKMRRVKEGITIPAGKSLELKPGGLHIMFIGLKKPFNLGDKIPVTLKFQRAGTVKVNFDVQSISSTSAMEGHHGGH